MELILEVSYCCFIHLNVTLKSQNHLGWKGPWRSSSPTVNLALAVSNYTVSPSAMSTLLLNTSRDGDSTTSLGSPFQCPTTHPGKKYFLISSLNLPWCNLRPLPLVLSLITWLKRLIPGSLRQKPQTQYFCLYITNKLFMPICSGNYWLFSLTKILVRLPKL